QSSSSSFGSSERVPHTAKTKHSQPCWASVRRRPLLGIASLEDLPSIADFIPDASVVETLERSLRVVPEDPTTPEQ
ncbi:MAG: hypothetical protein ACKOGL_11685, partial [Acidimicrobiaceae bacterium]